MKQHFTQAGLALLMAAVLSPSAAHADTVLFTLVSPVQGLSVSGAPLIYDITATAPLSNGAAVNLDGDSFNVSSPLILNDNDFFNLAPLFLNPGQTSTFDAFTIGVPAGTPVGNYAGSFSILGDAGNLGTVNFTTSVTPEPSSLILLGTGLAGALTALRNRRRSIT